RSHSTFHGPFKILTGPIHSLHGPFYNSNLSWLSLKLIHDSRPDCLTFLFLLNHLAAPFNLSLYFAPMALEGLIK
ncbi:hypothetical protein, partial [Aerococcus urinaeequi]|uniref:hypothetical protein n=1 Tax=Aerococcus urinaeequi TaxID=51665 RepID=UPI003D6C3C49